VTVARPGEEASRLRVGADVARAARLAMAAKYVDSLIVCEGWCVLCGLIAGGTTNWSRDDNSSCKDVCGKRWMGDSL